MRVSGFNKGKTSTFYIVISISVKKCHLTGWNIDKPLSYPMLVFKASIVVASAHKQHAKGGGTGLILGAGIGAGIRAGRGTGRGTTLGTIIGTGIGAGRGTG